VVKVLLTESYNRELVVSAFRPGARGPGSFLSHGFSLPFALPVHSAGGGGQIRVNTEQMNFLLASDSEALYLPVLNPNGRQLLTPREEQVVALVAEVSAVGTPPGNSTLASIPSRNTCSASPTSWESHPGSNWCSMPSTHSDHAVLTTTYWLVGRRLVEFEQRGKGRAVYGAELLKRLSCDLQPRFGRGFSERNLERMRQSISPKDFADAVCEIEFGRRACILAFLVSRRAAALGYGFECQAAL
jgi:hypothetical protein